MQRCVPSPSRRCGLLDRTLVVLTSEFGRDALMEGNGMHRHFTAAGSILLFENLHATMYHALGIPADTAYLVERRPVHVTRDGLGKPIPELLA